MGSLYDSLEHTMANCMYEGYSQQSPIGATEHSHCVH